MTLITLSLPSIENRLYSCARNLHCTWIGVVPVTPKPHCREWDCHNNAIQFVDWYGGDRVVGYYWLHDELNKRLVAILHSVVRRETGDLVDITPFCDDREFNVFSILKNQETNYTQTERWFSYE